MEYNLEKALLIQNKLCAQVDNWYCKPLAEEAAKLQDNGKAITLANHARLFKLQTLMEVFKNINLMQKKMVSWYLEHEKILPKNFVNLFNQTYRQIELVREPPFIIAVGSAWRGGGH